jgi:putative hydrolase of HD superfamily
MPEIQDLLKFVQMLNDYRLVERRLLVNGLSGDQERRENDIEHSYQLAMLCWYVISTEKLDLNLEKVFKYCLAHDLVEIYAGDTPFFSEDSELKSSKQEREYQALQRIRSEQSTFPDLAEWIEGYEKREDPESIFVYSMDKIQPMANIILDNGRSWKREKVTIDMEETQKPPKIAGSLEAQKIYAQLMQLVRERQGDLFFKEESEKQNPDKLNS